MSSEELKMIAFAEQGMPFNGSRDDEILPTFGLTPGDFYLRTAQVVSQVSTPGDARAVRFAHYCCRKAKEHETASRPVNGIAY
ncbi:hypothetical protein GP2_066_00070 [Gordonia paraffinivorans NBRC 108238]|uniref:DUF3263 domain-containing protein n=1 Tax=Gordonia paraffinivorans NBRC 108238 TaxID=1223543 RepID=A0ABQ0IS21_9ACTN|nr:hypothetical protein GP2_066_00070 [Gordonia paraffinivorans NBRC 108238]